MDKDEEDIWEVEEIISSRKVQGVVQYGVQWTGCTEFEDTWETFDYLDKCTKKLQEFQQKFPIKPQYEKDV